MSLFCDTILKKKFTFDFFFCLLAGPGAFLVRPSDNSPGDYTLFLLTNNIIQRFRVEKRGVKYIMGRYTNRAKGESKIVEKIGEGALKS